MSWLHSFIGLLMAAAVAQTTTFDRNTALRAVTLACSAYCTGAALANFTCGTCVTGITNVTVVNVGEPYDVQGYTGYDSFKQAVVLVFKGANPRDAVNVIASLLAIPTDFNDVGAPSGVQVHKGFLDLWTDSGLRNQTTQHVTQLQDAYPNASLLITGHSLGGAMASLAAVDLMQRRNATQINIVTFGSPRVGNEAWSQWFSTRVNESWRIVHNADIVPTLPPSSFGYQHVLREVWARSNESLPGIFNNFNATLCSATDPEDPTCSASACDVYSCDVDARINDHLQYLGLAISSGC